MFDFKCCFLKMYAVLELNFLTFYKQSFLLDLKPFSIQYDTAERNIVNGDPSIG
jgi:hypothetical protein